MDGYNTLVNKLGNKLGWASPVASSRGVWIDALCPVCNERKLTVNAAIKMFRCWKHCYGDGWTPVSKLIDGVDDLNIVAPPREDLWKKPNYISPGSLTPLEFVSPESDVGKYVHSRGMSRRTLSRDFGVKYCGRGINIGNGTFDTSNTLIFPITQNGDDIAWQSRLMYDPNKLSVEECLAKGMGFNSAGTKILRYPKYLTMPGFKKGSFLYNMDNAAKCDLVVLVEGTFDVFAVGRCAVATFGKSVTDNQVYILANNWGTVVSMLDSDAGMETARLRHRIMATGSNFIDATLPGDKDPGDTPRDVIWQHLDKILQENGVDLGQLDVII